MRFREGPKRREQRHAGADRVNESVRADEEQRDAGNRAAGDVTERDDDRHRFVERVRSGDRHYRAEDDTDQDRDHHAARTHRDRHRAGAHRDRHGARADDYSGPHVDHRDAGHDIDHSIGSSRRRGRGWRGGGDEGRRVL